jgi:hypothetical protein
VLVGPADVIHRYQINDIYRQPDLSARTDTKGLSETVANRSDIVYPIIAAEWPHNSSEFARVSLDRFKNHDTIDIHVRWLKTEGYWRAGRGGLTLSVRHLTPMRDDLSAALDRARSLGIVEGERA